MKINDNEIININDNNDDINKWRNMIIMKIINDNNNNNK